jgi:hypothetical protein
MILLFNKWLLNELLEEGIDCNIDDVNAEIRNTFEYLIAHPHYGDCTKQNVTCKICLFETWLREYYEYMKNQSH